MGPAMMSMSGPGATEVLAIYTEARALCDRLGEHPQLFPVLWGLWYINNARGQLQTARELGEQLLEVARTTADDALRLEAHHSLWSTCFVLEDLRATRPHFEQGLKLYDLRQHRTHAFLYGGHDPGVCCRMLYGYALAVLGHFDQALGRSEDALARAREVDHPLTTVVAHYYAGWVRHQRGERAEAVRTAQAAVALATTHGFNAWRAWGETLLAAVTADDAGDDLIARLERTLDAARAGLWGWKEVWSLGPLVAACARQEHVARGLRVLSEMSAQEHVLGFYGAELHRLTGELLLASDSPAAEASFRQAIAIARTRAEKSTDLRAAISLARLLQRMDRRHEARDLLADVYNWFTEGFDTADLVAAKALLEELAR